MGTVDNIGRLGLVFDVYALPSLVSNARLMTVLLRETVSLTR